MENRILDEFKKLKEKINDTEQENSRNIKKLRYYEFNEFNIVSEKIEEYLSEFTDEIANILPKNADIQSINFLLYETLINIYKHSKFKNAFVKIDNHDTLNIIIYDDGIGIPESFKEAQLEYNGDSESIFEAVNGKTTDKEKYNLHGRGLNSTARITTLGFGGEMIIMSGKGASLITKRGMRLYENEESINGTYILLQINNKKIDNIYGYLKYKPISKEENNESNNN